MVASALSIKSRVSSSNSMISSFSRWRNTERTIFPANNSVALIASSFISLGISKAALRFGDRAPNLTRGFDPFLNYHFGIFESFPVAFAVSHATGKFRYLGDERFVFFAPINNYFVLTHFGSPSGTSRLYYGPALPDRLLPCFAWAGY